MGKAETKLNFSQNLFVLDVPHSCSRADQLNYTFQRRFEEVKNGEMSLCVFPVLTLSPLPHIFSETSPQFVENEHSHSNAPTSIQAMGNKAAISHTWSSGQDLPSLPGDQKIWKHRFFVYLC